MKSTASLKRTTSVAALLAAMVVPSAAQETTGWTGGSAYSYGCTDINGNAYTCTTSGNNQWGTGSNWSNGLPDAGDDVSIGLSTYQSGYGARPARHDTVVIGSGTDAQARSVTIGFSGERSYSGSFGQGALQNEGTLTIGDGMLVGSTGRGSYVNNGTTSVSRGITVGGSGAVGDYVNNETTIVSGGSVVVANGNFDNRGTLDIENGDLIVGRFGRSFFRHVRKSEACRASALGVSGTGQARRHHAHG
ncbi:hypothetical protein [Mesorhizobium sp. RMAD-H1]|uniref:hypothetical protein n=1 Tax=Mesorhizobium sp. RMAD-H1 TaxID=2587065 RepID=UPI00161501D2|nr:hypothetical protein [Mesorhizobium sp. RMAD-H1]MBB2969805.1 hypothetical protein [Mesorhizobium sp. RMAD-H1]